MAGGQPRLLSRALMRPRARGRAAAAGHWLIVMIASFNMVKYMYLGKVYSITIQQCDAEILPSNSRAASATDPHTLAPRSAPTSPRLPPPPRCC
jgi:hypothetical protein